MGITIEESTTEKISPLLDNSVKIVLSESNATDLVQKDLLFLLIVVLMIENGFLLVDDKREVIDFRETFSMALFSRWKSPSGICEVSFILSGFKNIKLRLLMSPMGAMVLVNIVLDELNFETYSMCLPVSRYVVSPQATTTPMIFRDLRHFSVSFKNKILSAVKSRILSHHGYASASLIGLPDEVLLKIMIYLPVSDIIRVGKTCTRLKELLDNQSLWYCLNKRDFKNSLDAETDNWQNLYKRNYEQQQNIANTGNRRAGTLHDTMEYADYVYYIDNPMWDVIM